MLLYIWAKMFKKIRGVAIKNSTIDKTSKVESGSQVVSSTFGRHSFCGYDCQIINCDVGSFTSIANNVVIGGAQAAAAGSLYVYYGEEKAVLITVPEEKSLYDLGIYKL